MLYIKNITTSNFQQCIQFLESLGYENKFFKDSTYFNFDSTEPMLVGCSDKIIRQCHGYHHCNTHPGQYINADIITNNITIF